MTDTNEAGRERARAAGYRTMAEHAAAIIDQLRLGDDLSPHIVLGPIVWQPCDDGARFWYFVLATANAGLCEVDQIGSRDRAVAEDMRIAVAFAVRPPVVIHDFDDELEAARVCEMLWPSPKTAKLRAEIEAERRINGSAAAAAPQRETREEK